MIHVYNNNNNNNGYFKRNFSREHIAISLKKQCEHKTRKTNTISALRIMQSNI